MMARKLNPTNHTDEEAAFSPPAPAVGRPPSITRRQLQEIAIELFSKHGYDEVTIEDLAAAAGISRRTFFRYFPSKADALMGDFDQEVERLRTALGDTDPDLPIMEAVRRAVVEAHSDQSVDLAELRLRLQLQWRHPALLANANIHFEVWQRAVAEFVAGRVGGSADDLLAQVVAGSAFAAADAAFMTWLHDPRVQLGPTLDAALGLLASGFDVKPAGGRRAKPKSNGRK
jgi:mycofactocin system transcriptional regulator